MRVAVVGSRDYPDIGAVECFVDCQLDFNDEVVSGTEPPTERQLAMRRRKTLTVDEAAIDTARSLGMATKVFPADWNAHGKAAGTIRNREIAQYADRCVAFWDGKSRGTDDVIRAFKRLGKPVQVISQNSRKANREAS